MRNFVIVALAFALPACGVPVTPTPPIVVTTPPRDDILLKAARGFAAAEIEWQSAIAVGRALTAQGVIRGGTAVAVRRWNAEARALIVVGKATADAAEKARSAAGLLALVGKLDAITGRK